MISGMLILFIVRLANILAFLFFVRGFLSFFPHLQHHGIVRFIHDITEPFLVFVRRFPHRYGMIDFSLLIAMIGVELLAKFLTLLLFGLPF